MPSRDHYEGVWERVPEGLEPSAFELRRAFLLEHVSCACSGSGARSDSGSGDHTGGGSSGGDRRARVLDVGCGEGLFAAELVRAGVEVVGADVAEEPLRRGRGRHPELDLRLMEGEGPWPFPDSSFDAVWAGETIEHVLDTAGWLSELRRVLRSEGSLLLSTPDHGRLAMLRLALSARALDSHFDPRSDHLRFYTRRTLTALLEDFGFQDIEVRSAGRRAGGGRVLLARALRSRF